MCLSPWIAQRIQCVIHIEDLFVTTNLFLLLRNNIYFGLLVNSPLLLRVFIVHSPTSHVSFILRIFLKLLLFFYFFVPEPITYTGCW